MPAHATPLYYAGIPTLHAVPVPPKPLVLGLFPLHPQETKARGGRGTLQTLAAAIGVVRTAVPRACYAMMSYADRIRITSTGEQQKGGEYLKKKKKNQKD